MKSVIVYFSATGNTAKIAHIIQESLAGMGATVDEYDITTPENRAVEFDTGAYDTFVFGMPIHSCRAPRVVREWLKPLNGTGKKCAMFFTYGGFGIHPSHFSTKEILEESSFKVVSSAEFPGAHTYNVNAGWRAMIGRPNSSDFEVAEEFTQKTYQRFTGDDPGLLGEMEKTDMDDAFLDAIELYRFKVVRKLPTRDGESCSMCMQCEESCPTQAIQANTGVADGEKCICCLSCVANCPDEALKINDLSESWQAKLEMHQTSEAELKKQVSRIYL